MHVARDRGRELQGKCHRRWLSKMVMMMMMMMMVMSCFFYVRNQLIVVVRTRAMNFHAPRPPASRGYNSPLVVLLLRRRLLNLGRRRLLLLRCRLVLLRCLAPSVGVVPQLLSVPMLQVEEWQPTFTADAIATHFPGGGGCHDEAGGSHNVLIEQNALELKRCASCQYMHRIHGATRGWVPEVESYLMSRSWG